MFQLLQFKNLFQDCLASSQKKNIVKKIRFVFDLHTFCRAPRIWTGLSKLSPAQKVTIFDNIYKNVIFCQMIVVILLFFLLHMSI